MSACRRSGFVAAVLVACLVHPLSAGAKDADSISDKILKERETLEKLKQEIEEKRKDANEAEKKKDTILGSLQTLDEQLLTHRLERQAVNRQLKEKDRELAQINGRLADLRARITNRRSSILARMRVQYMEGRFGYLKALLEAGNYTDFLRRFQYLSTISEREYDLLQAFQADLQQQKEIERQREAARNEMLVYKRDVDQKLAEINRLRRDKKLFLASLERKKESYDQAVAELEKSASRVDALLRELEERRQAAARRARPVPDQVRPAKGILQWPADGEVVSHFGRQKHPTFETYVERKGIEIRTQEGSSIRAVMPGTVVYADWLKGYGLVVILDHGNGFFSLYAHASSLLPKVGDRVQAGQIIGETGDTGMTGESVLYFELRKGANPVDPLSYLAKRP
ncbi:MAG: murein hydrolase activator EnvC family protein [Nitrospirales bacterium]